MQSNRTYFLMGLLFLLVLPVLTLAQDESRGYVLGRLLAADDAPLSDSVVVFFNKTTGPQPAPGIYWRIPDTGGRIDTDGNFFAELVPGDYYFGAIRRPGRGRGLPQLADWRFVYKKQDSSLNTFHINPGQRLDLGTIMADQPIYIGPESNQWLAVLSGKVTDKEGKPLSGMVVEAYPLTPNATGWPLFSSDRTGDDGLYTIKAAAGEYKVSARQGIDHKQKRQKPLAQKTGGKSEVEKISLSAGETKRNVNFTIR